MTRLLEDWWPAVHMYAGPRPHAAPNHRPILALTRTRTRNRTTHTLQLCPVALSPNRCVQKFDRKSSAIAFGSPGKFLLTPTLT